ncbi:hypothetical protein WDJ50_18655 (plasmid) [Deinococcus sp. VB142]|uniref:Uncharacterized protein n=1 Tax=Deinococcus sp. VB142 TaxID=3112952 RepID=A0AAU6Q837_9DEIO
MTLRSDVLGAIAEVQSDPELNALRFPLSGSWSDGTQCRYAVKDPNKGQRRERQLQTDPLPASLRLLKICPGDPAPLPGSHADYQGGRLVLGLWSDESAYTGQRVGVCRLVDERMRLGLLDLPGQLGHFTPAEVQAMLDILGTPLEVQRQTSSGEWTADGRQSAASAPVWAGRGLLLPLSTQQAADMGSTTPTPLLRAYLPVDAPVSEPGFSLTAPPSALAYSPVRDAIYWEGRCWEVLLAAPGERSQ